MTHFSRSSYLFVAASLLMALVVASCGGGGSSATAIPTFTQIPTYNYVLPTSTVSAATAAPTSAAESTGEAASTSEAVATSEAASTSEAVATSEATAAVAAVSNVVLDQAVVDKGKGRYDALGCASCHGENGVGTDKGPSLAASTLNEGDFVAFMRSGGKLGAEHQFSTNRLSITGGQSLYQYMLSLRTSP